MKSSENLTAKRLACSLPCTLALAAFIACSQAADAPKPADASKDKPAASGDLVPLNLKLPAPAFKGTPKDIQLSSYVEPLSDKPRPLMMVPAGLSNIAPGKKITCSDKNATASTLEKITDGDKEAADESIIFLRKGTQWVQFDLGSPQELQALVIWHAHNSAKVYHDVIVQVSDDADFTDHVTTIFNNDQDNSSGLGVGTDREYFETFEGKLINAKGAKARYVRFYSKGSTESALNEYTEIEIFGRPAK
jgi:F5/8 type C domain